MVIVAFSPASDKDGSSRISNIEMNFGQDDMVYNRAIFDC